MESVVAGQPRIGNVVCDLDGVVYLQGSGVPGAGKALTDLDRAGHRIQFVTNNSTRPSGDVATKIEKLTGYPARRAQVVGSAQAAVGMVGIGGGPVFVLGGDGIKEALVEAGVEQTGDAQAAAAVIVGLDTGLSYDRLRGAVVAIRGGARFVATNTDDTYPTPDGLWPGAGAMVAAVQVATGVQPDIAGKPHTAIRSLIRAGLAPGPVWVVGDRPETDVALAKAEGWNSALVLTGVVERADEVPAEFQPDLVLDSIAALPEALQS